VNVRPLIKKIRELLRLREVVPPDDVADLCDEAEAALDVLDRIAAREAERAYKAQLARLNPGQTKGNDMQFTLAEALDLLDDVSAAFENVMLSNPPMGAEDRKNRLALIAHARAICDEHLRPVELD